MLETRNAVGLRGLVVRSIRRRPMRCRRSSPSTLRLRVSGPARPRRDRPVSVPEQHSDPHGTKITLAFLRLKSTSPQPGPPIFYLAGGPGGSGISLAKGPRGSLFLPMREAGDVIALDQRGVGLSEPNLA